MCSVVKQNIHFSRNFEIFALAFACTSISCCSIFNDQFPLHSLSCAQPWYYTTTARLCQEVLKKFLKTFFNRSQRAEVLFIIPRLFLFVKRFSKTFFDFSFKKDSAFFRHTAEAVCRKLGYYNTQNRICQAGKGKIPLCTFHINFLRNPVSVGISPRETWQPRQPDLQRTDT